jgi:hypothetical protein
MSSILNDASRPVVMFDASDKKHRGIYQEFLKNRSWGKSPIRFHLTEDHDNVVSMVHEMIANYHIEKEFGKIGV